MAARAMHEQQRTQSRCDQASFGAVRDRSGGARTGAVVGSFGSLSPRKGTFSTPTVQTVRD
ncbi:MAG: hypothetical protein QOJ68_3057 [Blastococcus sp.]|jgi:hypothetical protein|nr:hypothetical protein [Blastococcus sp.]